MLGALVHYSFPVFSTLLISRLSHCLCRLSSSVTDWWRTKVDSSSPWFLSSIRLRFAQQFEKEESCVPLLLLLSSWLDYHRSPLSTLGSIEERKKKRRAVEREEGRDQSAVKVPPERRRAPIYSRFLLFFFFLCVVVVVVHFWCRERDATLYISRMAVTLVCLFDRCGVVVYRVLEIYRESSELGREQKKKKKKLGRWSWMSFIHDVEPAEVRERKVKSQNEVNWFSRSVMQKKKKKNFLKFHFLFIYLHYSVLTIIFFWSIFLIEKLAPGSKSKVT